MSFRNAGLPARASCLDPTPCRSIAAKYPESTQRTKISIFRRLFNVVYVSPERQMEQDILSLIGGPYGRLTDEVERRIEGYLISNTRR